MKKLKLTEIQPQGWLLDQPKVQMNGLTGKLYEAWEYVGPDSGWLGGDGDAWERAPYYLDGLLPLAYYLNDEKHSALCRRFVEWTLNSQDASGNFGPESTKGDPWPHFVMLKVLLQFEEITGDPRVIPFMLSYLEYLAGVAEKTSFTGWTEARIPDLLYSAAWLYERTGDPRIPAWMRILDRRSLDWCDYLEDFPFPRPAKCYINWQQATQFPSETMEALVPYHATHIVNVAMGMKHPAMRGFYDQKKDYAKRLREGLATVRKKHGVPSGAINGDEHLAGANPTQGSELCSVVELMFSLQVSLAAFEEGWIGDLLERLAYNALPSTLSDDCMAHQYLQQANQVQVDIQKRPWFNNTEDSTIYGLEPHFGCCTANMHQGWPKFVNSLWMKLGEDTLVSTVLAPSAVHTTLGGDAFAVCLHTEYPFRENLTYEILEAPQRPVTLAVRIPGWCTAPEIRCNGNVMDAAAGDYLRVTRRFAPGDRITVCLPMEVRTDHWYHNAVSVERGPLVYGLQIRERWEAVREKNGIKDYCVYPESPWNYALRLDPNTRLTDAVVTERAVSPVPFAGTAPPVEIGVAGALLADWSMEHGNTADLPVSPVAERTAETVPLRLVPFGCTALRISEFPYYLAEV